MHGRPPYGPYPVNNIINNRVITEGFALQYNVIMNGNVSRVYLWGVVRVFVYSVHLDLLAACV